MAMSAIALLNASIVEPTWNGNIFDVFLLVLQCELVAFSKRSIKIEELAEAAIINPQAAVPFDLDDRFQDPYDILSILSSLVTASPKSDNEAAVTVKLAHFSVKESLVSERIQAGPASEYSIQEVQAHTTMAKVCLVYLLQFDTWDALISLETFDGFPLLEYAAFNWFRYARVIEENYKKSLSLSDKLWGQEEAFINWTLLYNLDYGSARITFFRQNWRQFESSYLGRYREETYHPI